MFVLTKPNDMDLNFRCEKVTSEAGGYKEVNVEIEGVSGTDVLNHFNIDDVVSHFDDDAILDHIGVDRVKEYFNLTETE